MAPTLLVDRSTFHDSPNTVASTLGISLQTLFRKLETEGVTFEQVLYELRHKTALHYLNGATRSVKQTARLVGFSDRAAFSRAFKRWTGTNSREHQLRNEERVTTPQSLHRQATRSRPDAAVPLQQNRKS